MGNKPRWKIPQFTKREINDAGDILRNKDSDLDDFIHALDVIDNWRSAHAYPLHVFYMNLRRMSGTRDDIIVAERLKRLESIFFKLNIQKNMKLCRMQDLGGCRMVVPTIKEVYEFSQKLVDSRIRHELKRKTDYIDMPKISGYRSLHLVYRFYSDSPEKKIFNEYPMLIEIQFRTHLQHIWATAVETIGVFTKQKIKSGFGEEQIKRFFVLVSSLFAIEEGCNVVPDTSDDMDCLVNELHELDKEYHVIETLKAIRIAIYKDNVPDKRGYYVLVLDYNEHSLKTWFFEPSQINEANALYDRLDRFKETKNRDVVLVRASSFVMLKAAYPNYFMDIGEFTHVRAGLI